MKILYLNKAIEVEMSTKYVIYNDYHNLAKCCIRRTDICIAFVESELEADLVLDAISYRCPTLCIFPDYLLGNYKDFDVFNNILFISQSSFSFDKIDEIIKKELVNLEINEEDKIRLVGSSLAIRKVRYQIDKYANNTFPIHFSGGSGTGKNIAAFRTHKLSGVSGKFVYLNCGTERDVSMMLTTLFGYTKGAFTGSDNPRQGLLKRADKSTIFFDELEEMSKEMQAVLLDVIESGSFRPIGSDKEIESNFRVLTASNVPLEELVDSGKLRTDFYNRIAYREIHMPDLKERLDDIPELVRDYELKHKVYRFRVRNYENLMNKNYKGNIRELYKTISLLHEENETNQMFPSFF